jgi:putative sterol carrier protein
MADYLSPAWFEAAARAVAADADLAAASRGARLVVQQTVDDDGARVVWHIRFEDGSVQLLTGPAADADVTFRCDRATASAVHEGRTSAQAAFMAGQLRVGGDVGVLLAHQGLLAGLHDALGPLRATVG